MRTHLREGPVLAKHLLEEDFPAGVVPAGCTLIGRAPNGAAVFEDPQRSEVFTLFNNQGNVSRVPYAPDPAEVAEGLALLKSAVPGFEDEETSGAGERETPGEGEGEGEDNQTEES